jgi:hypothetical protein
VNPKIAGKWMFIPLKMVLIGIVPYPYFLYGVLKHGIFSCLNHFKPSKHQFAIQNYGDIIDK